MKESIYKRVLIKISGEAISGEKRFGIDEKTLGNICEEIKNVVNMGVEVAVVIGGGNFWRGKNAEEMEQINSDYMGMLATTINGLALQEALEKRGIETVTQTAIEMRQIAEPYIRRKALKHLEKGIVVIVTCGTGNPFFTTDTAATLRAAELGAEVVLVAKTTDAIYSDDPKKNSNAIKYEEITYNEILNKELKVMDSTAISFARDNNIPLIVFGIDKPKNLTMIVKGEKIGTLVKK